VQAILLARFHHETSSACPIIKRKLERGAVNPARRSTHVDIFRNICLLFYFSPRRWIWSIWLEDFVQRAAIVFMNGADGVSATVFLWRQGLLGEGAVQVLYSADDFITDPILAAVGELQFEVVQHRMQNEYKVSAECRPLHTKTRNNREMSVAPVCMPV
jgi:hypothetical protein